MSEGLEVMKKMLGECQYIAEQEGAPFFLIWNDGETTTFLGNGNGTQMADLVASVCHKEPRMRIILQLAIGAPIELPDEDDDNTEND